MIEEQKTEVETASGSLDGLGDEASFRKVESRVEEEEKSSDSQDSVPQNLTWRERVYMETGIGAHMLSPGGYGCFTWCNLIGGIACFVFFLINAFYIIDSYIDGIHDPPMNIRVDFNKQYNFPPMVFCNDIVGHEFGNETSVSLIYYNSRPYFSVEKSILAGFQICQISYEELFQGGTTEPSFLVEPCTKVFPSVKFTSFKLVSLVNFSSFVSCFSVEGFPGWSKVRDSSLLWANNLEFSVDLGFEDESEVTASESSILGGSFYIYKTSKITPLLENTLNARTFSEYDAVLQAGHQTNAYLVESKSHFILPDPETGEEKETDELTYEVESHSGALVPKKSATVSFSITYTEHRRIFSNQEKPLFSESFGALGGWLGFLSNGMGIFSLAFIFQKCYLIRAKKLDQLYWYNSSLSNRVESLDRTSKQV